MEYNLIKWDEISHQIATNTDIQQLSVLRNKLTVYQELAKQSKQSMKAQNKIAGYRLRVDRKLGEWSHGLEARQGERSDLTSSKLDEVKEKTKRDYFKEIDIAPTEMIRKELIADIPEDKFEEYIQTEKEITTSGAVKLAKEIQGKYFVKL